MFSRRLRTGVRVVGLAATAFILSVSLAAASDRCARAPLPRAASQIVPTARFDQHLFSQAILVEVNYYRCRAGLAPVRLAGGLIEVASRHADWMARTRRLSHTSTLSGLATVRARVLASGLPVRRGSENIGYLPRFQFDGNRRIRVRDRAHCVFTTTRGRRIEPHTYASLAADIVDKWMRSAGHRRNLLDAHVNAVGAALGYDNRGTTCGQFYMAQNFAG